MPRNEMDDIGAGITNRLSGPSHIGTEKIIVRTGTKLYDTPPEIQATLESLRLFMGGLVKVGYDKLSTQGIEMKSFDDMTDYLKVICADPRTYDRLRFEYGDLLNQHIITVTRSLGRQAFSNFLNNIGTFDTLYSLQAVDSKNPDDQTLSIVGFGSTLEY